MNTNTLIMFLLLGLSFGACKSENPMWCPSDNSEANSAYEKIVEFDARIKGLVDVFDNELNESGPRETLEENQNYQQILDLKYQRDKNIVLLKLFQQKNKCLFGESFNNQELNQEMNN